MKWIFPSQLRYGYRELSTLTYMWRCSLSTVKSGNFMKNHESSVKIFPMKKYFWQKNVGSSGMAIANNRHLSIIINTPYRIWLVSFSIDNYRLPYLLHVFYWFIYEFMIVNFVDHNIIDTEIKSFMWISCGKSHWFILIWK